MSKAGPKRTKTEREADLTRIAEMDRLGYNQTEIAAQLKVSQQQVSYDLRTIWAGYRRERRHELNAYVSKLERQYDHIFNQCWRAYQESIKDATKTVEKVAPRAIKDAQGNPTGESVLETVEIATTTEGRLPASEYLALMTRVLEAKRALLGVDPPKKSDVRNLNMDFEALMRRAEEAAKSTQLPEQVEQQLEQLIQQIPQLPPADPPIQGNGDGHLPNGFKEIGE